MGISLRWLQTPADWTSFETGRSAVLFLYVPWSGYAAGGRRMIEQAERRWVCEHADQPVSWCAVDVEAGTVPAGIMAEWLSAQQPITGLRGEQLMTGGWGPLIWIENGNAVGFLPVTSQSSVEEIVARTREAFVWY